LEEDSLEDPILSLELLKELEDGATEQETINSEAAKANRPSFFMIVISFLGHFSIIGVSCGFVRNAF
jgi:hypothetical protein